MTIEVVDVEIEKLKARYADAMHAVQSGVAAMIETGDKGAEPKHLRTGVTAAMVDTGAIVALLTRKGIITEREHLEVLVEMAEKEKESYETRLTAHYGTSIKLG